MNHRPMIFHSLGDCCGQIQSGNATPVPSPFPLVGAIVCDDRYLTLAGAPRGKALVVPSEANCQVYLQSDNSGFVVYDATTDEVLVTLAPEFLLDVLNPAVAGNTPIPDPFSYIVMVGPGDGTTPSWHVLKAPTFGQYMLQVVGGRFILADIGSVPGLNDVGVNAQEIGALRLTGIIETAPGEWAIRMLTVADKRVVVGTIDGGVKSYHQLADNAYLEHPFAKFSALLQAYKFEQITAAGNVETGGLAERVTAGVTAVLDADRIRYSSTTRKFYREPAKVKQAADSSVDFHAPDDGTWQPITGHLSITTRFDYPDFLVMAYIRTQIRDGGGNPVAAGDYDQQYGLFIDGTLVHWWPIKGAKDNTIHRLYRGIAVGMDHSVTIRVNKTAVAGENLWILATNMDVFTVE